MKFIRRNSELGRPLRISSWRRIALGAWSEARDSSIYGTVDLDAGPALKLIERIGRESGSRVTITHFVVKAVAQVLHEHPEINSVLRLGRIYPRKNVDAFVMVASDARGEDLSGWPIRDADRKSLLEIAAELGGKGGSIRSGTDRSYHGMKSLYRALPGFLSRWLLRMLERLLVTFNLWSPIMGFPRDAFGGVMISSLGSLGLDEGFGALVPFTGIPLFITIGGIREVPILGPGGVIGRERRIRLGATIDHRVIDGVQAGLMARRLRELFADPKRCVGVGSVKAA